VSDAIVRLAWIISSLRFSATWLPTLALGPSSAFLPSGALRRPRLAVRAAKPLLKKVCERDIAPSRFQKKQRFDRAVALIQGKQWNLIGESGGVGGNLEGR
jgi:hypothetical protein